MQLASLVHQYQPELEAKYAARLLPGQRRAMAAMLRCRTAAAGQLQLQCSDCAGRYSQPLSCGHRSCPQCQNHQASVWLDRQRAKLLPVEYFMVTFSVPRELRSLAWRHQRLMYKCLFDVASSTLKDFGLNPKHLGADIGMSAVLHTHNRRLDYHPHLHVIVPGGGLDPARRQWRKTRGYLFNEFALAKVFRARLLAALIDAGLSLPDKLPLQWVVDCRSVGKGGPALEYLSRYLYRGTISEKNIIANRDGMVRFRYVDAKTGTTQYRSLSGADFLWLVLQHVLPKGFHRVRDYGFLHANAKQRLSVLQLVLHVIINALAARARPLFKCPRCHTPMRITGIVRSAWSSG